MWLERQATHRPGALAVDSVTYAELLARAREAAVGDPHPIAHPPGLDFAIELHAVLLQAGTAIPIDRRLTAEEQRARAAARPAGADVALIMFTSGTSAAPKPVELSYGNVEANARGSAEALGVTAEDRWLCPLPLTHVGGLMILTRAVICGFHVLLDPPFDADRVAARLNAGEATFVSLVPTQLKRCLDAGLREPRALRAVVCGGAPLDAALRARAQYAGVPVVDAYGLTETASQVVVEGVPLPGADVGVEDDEIVVRGPMVAGGELRTGDLGEWRDGRLRVLGRRGDLIITGGENVSPEEVEAVLGAHPAVSDAGVFGRPDPEWGEAVTAHVIGSATPEELDAWCRERLARFKVPKNIEIVRSLPRTTSGKLLRRSMR
jgi:O-succinylbenzoic acid--CoA ligase